jgi:hypothetical protein
LLLLLVWLCLSSVLWHICHRNTIKNNLLQLMTQTLDLQQLLQRPVIKHIL